MADPTRISDVLNSHPELTTYEDVVDQCRKEGVHAGIWGVRSVARSLGRHLTRRPYDSPAESEIRELACMFAGLHNMQIEAALATLDRLKELNEQGIKLPTETLEDSQEYGLELSVGQEFADAAGGVSEARQILRRL